MCVCVRLGPVFPDCSVFGRDENSEGAVISPALKLRKVQEAQSFNLTFNHLIKKKRYTYIKNVSLF